jgi:hypothetical protein
MARNLYEELGRTRKVYALVSTLERLSRTVTDICGYDVLIPLVRSFSDEQWAKLAICAGCRPPSDKTREETIHALECRAERLRLESEAS